MGFSFAYQTTRPVTPAEAEAITRGADAAQGRSWLSCEPVHFHEPASEDEAGETALLMDSIKPDSRE